MELTAGGLSTRPNTSGLKKKKETELSCCDLLNLHFHYWRVDVWVWRHLNVGSHRKAKCHSRWHNPICYHSRQSWRHWLQLIFPDPLTKNKLLKVSKISTLKVTSKVWFWQVKISYIGWLPSYAVKISTRLSNRQSSAFRSLSLQIASR